MFREGQSSNKIIVNKFEYYYEWILYEMRWKIGSDSLVGCFCFVSAECGGNRKESVLGIRSFPYMYNKYLYNTGYTYLYTYVHFDWIDIKGFWMKGWIYAEI